MSSINFFKHNCLKQKSQHYFAGLIMYMDVVYLTVIAQSVCGGWGHRAILSAKG